MSSLQNIVAQKIWEIRNLCFITILEIVSPHKDLEIAECNGHLWSEWKTILTFLDLSIRLGYMRKKKLYFIYFLCLGTFTFTYQRQNTNHAVSVIMINLSLLNGYMNIIFSNYPFKCFLVPNPDQFPKKQSI